MSRLGFFRFGKTFLLLVFSNEEWQKLGDAFNGFYDFMNFDKELRVPRRLNASISETSSAPERSAELDQRSYFWSASRPPSDSGKDRALYYQFDGGEHTLDSGQTDKRIALFCRCVKVMDN